jgi:RES domain-containing protein
MLAGERLQAALEEIPPQAFQGTLFRCVSLRALLGLAKDARGKLLITRPIPDFLYSGGPEAGGGRFTPKGGARSLYMGETARTARLEKRQAAGFATIRPKAEPIEVTYALDGRLSAVLDLTDPRVRAGLKTSRTEMVAAWRFRADGKTPPTHMLGTAVIGSRRFSSIRYPSAAHPRGRCIVVFPDRMHAGESVAVLDEDSIIDQILTVATQAQSVGIPPIRPASAKTPQTPARRPQRRR